MAKKVKITKGGQTVYPATVMDAVVHPDLRVDSSKLIEEVNVSKIYPTGGIDGTNKYTLETAIAMIPASLRNVGIKCSFLDEGGELETWEYMGGGFTTVTNWKQAGARGISKIKNEVTIISLNNQYINKINVDADFTTKGIWINTSGVEQSLAAGLTSKYIDVTGFSTVYFPGYAYGGTMAGYDENFKFVRMITTTNGTYNIGEDIRYIRLSLQNSNNNEKIFLYTDKNYVDDRIIYSTVYPYGVTYSDITQDESITKNTQDIDTNSKDINSLKQLIQMAVPPDSIGEQESIVVGGNLDGTNNLGIPSNQISDVSDSFLNADKINKMMVPNTDYSSDSGYFVSGFIENTDVGKIIKSNLNKFTRFEAYIYCKEQNFEGVNFAFYSARGQVQGVTKLNAEDTTSSSVKIYAVLFDNSVLQESDYLYFNTTIKGLEQYTERTDFGITGFKIALFDSLEEAKVGTTKGDWLEISGQESISIKDVKDEIRLEQYGEYGKDYNNVKRNQDKIGIAIRLIKTESKPKLLNQYERVVVSFNGDSIIGAQLDDITHSSGYDTGDFPPNMSKNILARMFWEKYRFADEDVIFRNLIHSDWTKTGFAVSNGKDDKSQTFNEIEVYGCAEGDSAEITISGQTYVKFVWSEYKGKPYSFDIMQKVDGRAETKLETVEVTSKRSLMTAYSIKKLNKTSTYKFRIVPTSGFPDVCFWGIEAWNNPRLDVIVEAFSGSIARLNRNNLLDGYYSDFHRPALLISDMLIINDTSYVNGSDYSVDQWMNDNAALYHHLRENGVPALFFIPHCPFSSFLTESAEELAKMHGLAYINIPLKQKQNAPTQSIVNNTDGLHLSNYGQTYYFEELERVIDNYVF